MLKHHAKKKAPKFPYLSEPSKMECYTFDLDIDKSGCADRCQYGQNKICYVIGNRFRENAPSRIAKKERNWKLANSKDFVRILTAQIRLTKKRIFRFFQSGDFFSLEFFKKVMRVCENLPKVDFWIPTSRDDILNQFLSEGGVIPENTTLRLSAPIPNMPFHEGIIQFYSKWKNITFSETTTDPSLTTCHASLVEGSSCGDCEDCFKPTHKKTVYAIHGKANINNFKKYEELA
jgi:hypothetical protein